MTLYYYLCKWTESDKDVKPLHREPHTYHYGILCGGNNGQATFDIHESSLLRVGLLGRILHDEQQAIVLSEKPPRSLLYDAHIKEHAKLGMRARLLKHYERIKPITPEELREHCAGLEEIVYVPPMPLH
jgi:hypothetical protein